MVNILCGDVLSALRRFEANRFDAVVCDPPYALAWMGRAWDDFASNEHDVAKIPQALREMQAFQHWCMLWGSEVIRVLKPGGHLVAFGGSRTSHRLVCGLEDAGFEYRQTLAWIYPSGMTKSYSVAKALAKVPAYAGRAEQWLGWGTALKPASEPIVVVRKPGAVSHGLSLPDLLVTHHPHCVELPGGDYHCTADCPVSLVSRCHADVSEVAWEPAEFAQSFFLQSKPSVRERNAGCDELFWQKSDNSSGFAQISREAWAQLGRAEDHANRGTKKRVVLRARGNIHSTVKPLALARTLARAVCPPGGELLVPFAGSGTEVVGGVLEQRNVTAVEREVAYVEIIKHRLRITLPRS